MIARNVVGLTARPRLDVRPAVTDVTSNPVAGRPLPPVAPLVDRLHQDNIELAERQAERTAADRARARERAAVQRDRTEPAYRDELVAAIVTWLNFTDEHAQLADQIAQAAADHAAVVGSGRVGRTSTLSLEEKAALAARAHIRHHHTDYEDQLIEHEATTGFANLDTETYRALRTVARRVVDAFIDEHRDQSSDA